ncbi:hypothetical protein ACFSVJ_01080 [Prauserella oleivorans]
MEPGPALRPRPRGDGAARGARPGLLWERFASLLGLDPARYSTDVPHYGNFSLGYAETELLRRVNQALDDDFPWLHYAGSVKDRFAATVLAGRSGRTHIPLPKQDAGWVRDTAERHIAEVTAAGVDVVGDLAELLPADPPADPPETAEGLEPGDAELLDIAVTAIADLLQRPAEATSAPARRPPKKARAVRLRQVVMQLSEQYPQVMSARRAYWRAKARLRR